MFLKQFHSFFSISFIFLIGIFYFFHVCHFVPLFMPLNSGALSSIHLKSMIDCQYHAAFQNSGIQFFIHLLANSQDFLMLVSQDFSQVIAHAWQSLKNYFRYSSTFIIDLNQLFKSVCKKNIHGNNDLDANESRLTYCRISDIFVALFFCMYIYIISM